MTPLPIDAHLPEIVEAARSRRGVVVVAPPGAGKTTRVPVGLLAAAVADPTHPAILVLQPRRVAARSVAARIAEENGWALGVQVGYHVRFERKIGPATRLQVLTEGILNRRLIADPFLEGVGAVVLDEFHERSLHTDLAVALLREVRESVRPDLVLVVMSATMDPAPVATFLGAPVVHAPGRTFPVAIEHRGVPRDRAIESLAAAVGESLAASTGHVLAFLPGAEEIRRAARAVEPAAAREGASVMPLHGNLPAEEQDRAIRPSSRRKVVLATNIAETSLTIDGVATVVDLGLARQASYDPVRGLDRLELVRISKASADQRAGRAGRTGPGRCIRLWSERDHRALPEADLPEIRRVDLAATVLALRSWGQSDPRRFGWFDPPDEGSLASAERVLAMLGALEGEGGPITPLGRRLLALPAHPRQARLLLAAAEAGCAREGAAMAALLAEKDILLAEPGGGGRGPARPSRRESSDLLLRLDRLAEAEAARFAPRIRQFGVDPAGARRVATARDDLLRQARRVHRDAPPAAEGPDEATLLRLPLLAYPDRVARRRGPDDAAGVMVGGRGVRLEPGSVVRDSELFLALDPRDERRGGAREARVRIASAIEPAWLEELYPDQVVRERSVRFDPERGRVEGVRITRYRDLVLREDRHESVPEDEAARALAEALRPEAAAFAAGDEGAAAFLARVAFLRAAMPDLDFPAFDEPELAETLESACRGCRSVAEVRRVPLAPILRGRLTFAQARALDEHAPEALAVPSGNRIRLAYEPGRPPVLAARLQELFGWTDTPRLAAGRAPVLLHLLGPNFRPVQVTDDLRSFWATTYFQVRKDLRARYPRHSWPDDPLTARPESKGGRRS